MRALRFWISILTISTLGVCAAAVPDAAAQGKIVVAQAVDNIVFLPTYVAIAKGYWKEEGLDVDLQMVKDGPVAVTAVLAGQAQATANSADTPLLAKKAGGNIIIVANLLDKGMADIVVSTAALKSRGITMETWNRMPYADRAKLYKGLRWAIIGPGGLTDLLVRASIKAAGYEPDRDTSILPIGGSPEIYAAFKAGRVDVMLQAPPYSRVAVAEGVGVIAGGLHEVGPQFADFAYEVIAVEAGWATKNAETVRKLVRAIARACDYVRSVDSTQVAKDLHGQGYFTNVEPTLLAESVKAVVPTVAPGGRITKASIDNMVKFYLDAGTIKAGEMPSTQEGGFWTTEYLPKR
jgi:NitT/TauT family transport system substrate-binding protein